MQYKLKHITDAFLPISLDQMGRVQLMNRTDTKFLGNSADLEQLLIDLLRDYYMLEINEERILPYHTIYYDTPDFQLYNMHHNGKLNRVKIRVREYEISQLGFLEIKKKNNKRRTDKKRIETTITSTKFENEEANFIDDSTFLSAGSLEEKLYNHFNRITLVGKERNERITIDLNLNFETPENNGINVNDFVIVEVKQDKQSGWSPIKEILKRNQFKNHGFSKYCVGSMLLYPHIKYNRFKDHLRMIEKISGTNLKEEIYHEQFIRNNKYDIAV